MQKRVTARTLAQMRAQGEKIVCLTAYDMAFAKLADQSGVDVVLVGDSLGNVVYGYESTIPVTLAQMEMHTKSVAAGVERALLVADLPFGSYQASPQQAVESAVMLMKAGAQAVKLEGLFLEAIKAIRKAGIPVMGHLGFTPQAVYALGGHRVQGRGEAGERILEEAREIEEAGVFAMVLELVPRELAQRITDSIETPTIGIGAGAGCSGQIQVMHDLIGMANRPMKHAKTYFDGNAAITGAFGNYVRDVKEGTFPAEEHSA